MTNIRYVCLSKASIYFDKDKYLIVQSFNLFLSKESPYIFLSKGLKHFFPKASIYFCQKHQILCPNWKCTFLHSINVFSSKVSIYFVYRINIFCPKYQCIFLQSMDIYFVYCINIFLSKGSMYFAPKYKYIFRLTYHYTFVERINIFFSKV